MILLKKDICNDICNDVWNMCNGIRFDCMILFL